MKDQERKHEELRKMLINEINRLDAYIESAAKEQGVKLQNYDFKISQQMNEMANSG